MGKHVVYFPADNDEGYHWESVETHEVELYINSGWYRTPAELKDRIAKESEKTLTFEEAMAKKKKAKNS